MESPGLVAPLLAGDNKFLKRADELLPAAATVPVEVLFAQLLQLLVRPELSSAPEGEDVPGEQVSAASRPPEAIDVIRRRPAFPTAVSREGFTALASMDARKPETSLPGADKTNAGPDLLIESAEPGNSTPEQSHRDAPLPPHDNLVPTLFMAVRTSFPPMARARAIETAQPVRDFSSPPVETDEVVADDPTRRGDELPPQIPVAIPNPVAPPVPMPATATPKPEHDVNSRRFSAAKPVPEVKGAAPARAALAFEARISVKTAPAAEPLRAASPAEPQAVVAESPKAPTAMAQESPASPRKENFQDAFREATIPSVPAPKNQTGQSTHVTATVQPRRGSAEEPAESATGTPSQGEQRTPEPALWAAAAVESTGNESRPVTPRRPLAGSASSAPVEKSTQIDTQEAPRVAPAPNELRLRVAGPDSFPVDLHVRQRMGEVHVAVRTPDLALQSSLRQDLPELAQALNKAGFDAALTAPVARASGAEIDTRSESGAGEHSPPGDSRGHNETGGHSQGQAEDSRHRGRMFETWLEQMEE